MVSNPLFIIPDFFLHFPNELSYGFLRKMQRKTWYSLKKTVVKSLNLSERGKTIWISS